MQTSAAAFSSVTPGVTGKIRVSIPLERRCAPSSHGQESAHRHRPGLLQLQGCHSRLDPLSWNPFLIETFAVRDHISIPTRDLKAPSKTRLALFAANTMFVQGWEPRRSTSLQGQLDQKRRQLAEGLESWCFHLARVQTPPRVYSHATPYNCQPGSDELAAGLDLKRKARPGCGGSSFCPGAGLYRGGPPPHLAQLPSGREVRRRSGYRAPPL